MGLGLCCPRNRLVRGQGEEGAQGGDPQPGLCGGCERGEGPCAPAGSALGTAALRRMPPASQGFPEAVLPLPARCAPGQIAPAHRGCPDLFLSRGELCSGPGASSESCGEGAVLVVNTGCVFCTQMQRSRQRNYHSVGIPAEPELRYPRSSAVCRQGRGSLSEEEVSTI